MLRFGAAYSTAGDHQQALDEVLPRVLGDLDGPPDLVVCFMSMHHADVAAGIALGLSERTGTSNLIGCTGQGVIGEGRELEDGPALSLWAARLPGVEVRPFGLEVHALTEGQLAIAGWPAGEEDEQATALMLADPFSFPADAFLERLNDQAPGMTVLGGFASGGTVAGRHRLLHGIDVLDEGAVGVVLTGPVDIRPVVSQGCRPIGRPFVVTRGEGNLVHELAGRPAVDRLKELLEELGPRDEALLRLGGLQVGQVLDEHKADFERGDFLIRQLAGADPDTGTIAVGDSVELGSTLQFHLRDAEAADEELAEMLGPVARWNPKGVLLFSCNGRGERFFGTSDHDAAMVRDATGGAPTAGFFAQGELGPVGGRNFVHAYTASLAVFCEPGDPVPAEPAVAVAEEPQLFSTGDLLTDPVIDPAIDPGPPEEPPKEPEPA